MLTLVLFTFRHPNQLSFVRNNHHHWSNVNQLKIFAEHLLSLFELHPKQILKQRYEGKQFTWGCNSWKYTRGSEKGRQERKKKAKVWVNNAVATVGN